MSLTDRRALLLGGHAPLPFLGHFRAEAAIGEARLWVAGRVAIDAGPVEAWAAARVVEAAIEAMVEGLATRRAPDRHALLRAAWEALMGVEAAALGPRGGADASVLCIVADAGGQGVGAAGLSRLLAGDDPGLNPVVPVDHPMLTPPGLPREVPHMLSLRQLPALMLAVPWGHPGPLPEPGRARAAAGDRP